MYLECNLNGYNVLKLFSLYNINKDEFFSPTNTLNFTPDNIIGLNDDIYAFSGNRFSINSRNTGWENITLSNLKRE